MKKGKILAVLMAGIISIVLTHTGAMAYIPPGVTSGYLYASYTTQQKSNWCWVATAQNATIQEGCNIYDQYYAVYILKGATPDFYPNVPGTIGDAKSAAEIICDHALTYTTAGAKTFAFISDKIYNGHSIMAGYTYVYNGSTYGHMVLLMGWNTSSGTEKVKFFDPGNGCYYTVTYAAFCSGMYNGSVYNASCYVN
ncbi:MAG: hypothetical protein K6F26_06995 [Lachnospiraceae bacterium]|nr:hypothetical protein [Lachnospiraceae bacterium]